MNDIKISDVIKMLPYSLRNRYISLRKYINEELYPSEERYRILKKINEEEKKIYLNKIKNNVEITTTVSFIFLLRQLFIETYNATVFNIDFLKKFDISNYYIGKVKYEGRNENVMIGKELSDLLLKTISSDEIKEKIISSSYLYEIINFCKEKIIDA